MFLYFVPGLKARAREAKQLAYAFENGIVGQSAECSDGPSGQPGTLIADRSIPSQFVRFDPQSQTWRQCGDWWLGYWTADRPTPATLQRGRMLDGNEVRLADGNRWLIPRAFRYDGNEIAAALPRMVDVDTNGEWILGDVRPDLRELWKVATRFYDAWIGAVRRHAKPEGTAEDDAEETHDTTTTISLTLPDELDMVETCLQVNYRISRFELGALGLIDGELPTEVLLALIDWPNYLAAIKKKTQTA